MRVPTVRPRCERCAQPAMINWKKKVLCEHCYVAEAHEELVRAAEKPSMHQAQAAAGSTPEIPAAEPKVNRITTTEPTSMRQKMPHTAAFVDAMREAFGRETIDGAIRQSTRSGAFDAKHPLGAFSAEENGHVVGAPRSHVARAA